MNEDIFVERVRNKSTEKNLGSSWDLNPRPSEYRIAGSFRWVQIFAIFENRPASAKIKTVKK